MTSPAIAPPLEAQAPGLLFARRLWAISIRHIYLYMGSWPRLLQMMYWPIINMLSLGFTSFYIVKKMTGAEIIGNVLIGGVLLNEFFMRMNFMMVIMFLEEIWSRNLGHLFASPIRLREYTLGLILTAITCMLIGVIPATLLARWLFGFSILGFGWPLLPMLALLIFNGCWFGLLIMAMLFRYGVAAEWLCWMGIYLFTPLIAPYYPVSVLPHALQYVAWSLPATYVFDAMKGILNGQSFNTNDMWIALALNIGYSILAAIVYVAAYRSAQKRGGILQVGE